MNRLRRWFGFRTADDDLVDLILVAKQDHTIRQQLLVILTQPEFQRQSLLNTWIEELTLSNAPMSLIRALTSLTNNDLARCALHQLQPPEVGPG